MIDVICKPLWAESIRKRHNDLSDIVEWELFRNWETGSNLTILISGELRMALDVLYSGLDPELGRRFLERSWALIERTERDGMLPNEKVDVAYDLHMAEYLSCKAYVRAVREGITDASLFRQAGEHCLGWIRQTNPRAWDDLDHELFLTAMAVRLLVDNPADALKLFDEAVATEWCRPDPSLFRDLCTEWIRCCGISEPLKLMLCHRFDMIRNPRYQLEFSCNLHQFRLEFGAIIWKYVEHPEATEIDWKEVIELISR